MQCDFDNPYLQNALNWKRVMSRQLSILFHSILFRILKKCGPYHKKSIKAKQKLVMQPILLLYFLQHFFLRF